MGSSKENPNNSYLPDLESKNSESLSLLSVSFLWFRQSKYVWKDYGKNWDSTTM